MFEFIQSKSSAFKDAIVLKETTEITEELKTELSWKSLLEQYLNVEDKFQKAAVTLCNAILSHRRVFFCMERDGFRTLIKGDKNWQVLKKKTGFKNEDWKALLDFFYRLGLIKYHYRGSDHQVSIYMVCNKGLIEALGLTPEETATQQAEAEQFLQKKHPHLQFTSNQDDAPDNKQDGETSKEKSEPRKEEKEQGMKTGEKGNQQEATSTDEKVASTDSGLKVSMSLDNPSLENQTKCSTPDNFGTLLKNFPFLADSFRGWKWTAEFLASLRVKSQMIEVLTYLRSKGNFLSAEDYAEFVELFNHARKIAQKSENEYAVHRNRQLNQMTPEGRLKYMANYQLPPINMVEILQEIFLNTAN